jgi:hypothetical protein
MVQQAKAMEGMIRLGMTMYHCIISSHILGAMLHVVQEYTDSSLIFILILILILILMPSHYHTHQIHHHQHSTYSLHAPVRVCRFGIETAIAMHASPSFCIAVTDDGTGDGTDVDGDIVG